jgi:hypothetical protein
MGTAAAMEPLLLAGKQAPSSHRLGAAVQTHDVHALPLEWRLQVQFGVTLGKLVNICSEIGSGAGVPEARLKAFVSGDTMSFNRKYLEPFQTRATARLVGESIVIRRCSLQHCWRRGMLTAGEEPINGGARPLEGLSPVSGLVTVARTLEHPC